MENISSRLDHDNLRFFWCTIILLTGISFVSTLLAGQDCVSKPSPKLLNPQFKKAEIIQKIQILQIPFIANERQTDEKVAFYANTFGCAVFMTKNGNPYCSILRILL